MTEDQQQQQGWTDEQQRRCADEEMVARVIVYQVLRDDHPERWTRAELEAEAEDLVVQDSAASRSSDPEPVHA